MQASGARRGRGSAARVEPPPLPRRTLENPRDRTALAGVLAPVMASKHAGYEALLAGLVADAVLVRGREGGRAG